ncbi:hypothetical protein PORY_001279 [Pneumocystis oryctolagi]|uniref:Uncharacterized protein n=1 Tax=Pneumocystis oryctolagi TaxID=42067 RepID=A0ACB7CBK7_9ASCO|nr:hypothetical protein PORY_001279 [Pneumocystis oryctolagi]
MRVFVFLILVNIIYVISKGNNKEIDLIKPKINIRRNGDSGVKKHPVLKDSVYKKEYFLAIILQVDGLHENVCKNYLSKYCEELKSMDSTLSNVEEKVKEICGNISTVCYGHKQNIVNECKNFKTTIQSLFQNNQMTSITKESCEDYQQKCLLLNDICYDNTTTDLTEFCTKIMNFCYQEELDNIAEQIILRALKGNLTSQNNCTEKLKEHCPILSKQSNELMLKCLNPETTCKLFVNNTNKTCENLKKGIEEASKNNNLFIKVYNELLEKCYFYDSSCNGDVQEKCKNFKEKCNKKNITYTPPGPPFNPIEYPALWLEKIGLQDLYTKAEKQGIFIAKPSSNRDYEILSLLATNTEKKAQNLTNICTKDHSKNCSYIKQLLEGTSICNNTSVSQIEKIMCGKLNSSRRCDFFKAFLTLNGLSYSIIRTINISSLFYRLYQLPVLTREECDIFKWSCFYLQKHCQTHLENTCININVACYKTGIYNLVNTLLEKSLYGLLHDTDKDPKDCREKLFKTCTTLRYYNIYTFIFCLRLNQTCKMLEEDVHRRGRNLQNILGRHKDFPTKKHCFNLVPQCNDLVHDNPWLKHSCYTLKRECTRLENTETLKYNLLEDKTDTLMNVNNCLAYLQSKCRRWFRRRNHKHYLICIELNRTCSIMVDRANKHCDALKINMKNYNIINAVKAAKTNSAANETELENLETICNYWEPYCDQLMPVCPQLLNTTGNDNDLCARFKEHCKSFRKNFILEEKLMHVLKGNLQEKDKCEAKLTEYCKQDSTIKIFENLCKNITTSSETTKNICNRLIRRLKKRCIGLPDKLKKEIKELTEKKKQYDELKKDAKEAMSNSSLILSAVITGRNYTNNLFTRNSFNAFAKNMFLNTGVHEKNISGDTCLLYHPKDVEPSGVETDAFDVTADAISLYVELKKQCSQLRLDCSFKDDCLEAKDGCNQIEETCKSLEPFKIPPKEKVIEVSINTVTKTKTINATGKTIVTSETITVTVTNDTYTITSPNTTTKTVFITETLLITKTKISTSIISVVTMKDKETQSESIDKPDSRIKPSEGTNLLPSILWSLFVITLISQYSRTLKKQCFGS